MATEADTLPGGLRDDRCAAYYVDALLRVPPTRGCEENDGI